VFVLSGLTATSTITVSIFKNGIIFKQGNEYTGVTSGGTQVSCDDTANGSDYYEAFIYGLSSSSISVNGAVQSSFFTGHVVSSAGPTGPAGSGGGAATSIADTPPATPTNGQLWWESDTGTLWISYNDGNSTQWVAVGGGSGGSLLPGSRVLIQTQTVTSGQAAVNFITGIDATYDEYVVDFNNYSPTSEAQLNLQISQDGGATWKTDGAYQVALTYVGAVGAAAFIQGTASIAIPACPSQIVAGGGSALGSAVIRFWRPTKAEFHMFMVDAVSHSSSLSFMSAKGMGSYAGNSNAMNGIRFLPNAGVTFVSGTFNLYGIKK
jgi:hypothetical protein